MTTLHPAPSVMTTPEARPFTRQGADRRMAMLMLHGFTSTPQSVRHVALAVHAGSGITVDAPLLAGHGTTPEDLATTGHRDWLASAETAFERLSADHDHIVVGGLSLGGTIALNIAARHAGRVAGVAVINASTGLYPPEAVAPLFDREGSAMLPGIGSEIADFTQREICYDRIPAATLRERIVLTGATAALLPRITCPILIMQSRVDGVVAPENAHRIAQTVGSDDIHTIWLAASRHVATLDHDRDRITSHLIMFLKTV